MGKVFAVGVGPGSPKYVTEVVKDIVQKCDIVIGYKYTLKTIENLIEDKEIYEITMNDQENYCLIGSISPLLVKLSSRRIHVCIDFYQEGDQTFFDHAHFTNTGNTKITLLPRSTSDFVKH